MKFKKIIKTTNIFESVCVNKPIQDIKQGDMVLTHRKRFKEVKGIQKYQEEKEVAVVKFTHNGEQKKVECTKDHEFFIIPQHYGKDFKNVKWASAQELHKGDILLLPLSSEKSKSCSHKGHEDCLNCFGKKNKEWVEEYNRQYHETASNANRVVEKALNNLSVMVMDKELEESIDKAKYSLEELKELFGMSEAFVYEKDMDSFGEELSEIGYEIGIVEEIIYEHYQGDVYDLTVEGDTSYTVNGVAVHNSAAGSLVSYAVGITNVDPIQYGLLFERFLNPSRSRLPDIDTDFCIVNRGRVMNYVAEKHGKEHVANIATFGRLQTKAVIKDVAKSMGIPFEEVNNFTRTLPSGPMHSIHVHEIVDKEEYQYFVKKYPSLFDYASKLESSPRHVSQHAAGMVVSPPEHPIWTLIPVQKGKEVVDGVEAGYLAQLEKEPVEKLGLVKYDFLGLKNITELQDQFNMVKQMYGVDLNFDNIPIDDKKTWDLISSCQTQGMFQFSSKLAISVLDKIKPTNIEELAAANSFIRPGVIGLDEYVETKHNPQKVRKLHPKIDHIFEKTYGAMVFQEQLMELVGTVMGIDFGAADIYRRMLEKPSKFVNEVAKWKEEFVQKGIENGFGEKLSTYLIDFILNSAGYSFNKSHAVCYSIIGYWTAYMKANYPLVFYTTILNGNLEEADVFMSEARKAGIQVLPPHVNHSKLLFTIEGESGIRAGFNVIKGVGPAAVESIVKNQPYESVDDYFDRNEKAALNKAVIAALIKSGCFEGLGILVEDNDILEENKEKLKLIDGKVVMNASKMSLWYELLNENKAKKTNQSFLVPLSMIKGKYFDELNIVKEKDSVVVVVPEDRLKCLGLSVEKLPDKTPTRKKPKGSFEKEVDPLKGVNILRKTLIVDQNKIASMVISDFDRYLTECNEFGFSFVSHPLEKNVKNINIYDEVDDGKIMVTAGIITEIIERKTAKGKLYYWIMIKSPRDTVRVTVWENQMKIHKSSIVKNNLVVVKGVKGFGGMSLEELKVLKKQ